MSIPAFRLFGVALLMAVAGTTAADEVIQMESTVIGNQEQPKVLYIIPWKNAESLARLDSGLPRTIGDVFEHRDYSEFRREVKLMQSGKDRNE